MASTVTGSGLPTGSKVFTTLPDILFIPEFIFGGLVWCLVASTRVFVVNPQGWVMFVSVFCFVFTTIWFFIFICGGNQGGIWPGLDALYHFIAVVFYLSASVLLANVTIGLNPNSLNILTIPDIVKALLTQNDLFKIYQEDIAAVVMAYMATLMYFIHAILSALRWKSS